MAFLCADLYGWFSLVLPPCYRCAVAFLLAVLIMQFSVHKIVKAWIMRVIFMQQSVLLIRFCKHREQGEADCRPTSWALAGIQTWRVLWVSEGTGTCVDQHDSHRAECDPLGRWDL